jgi:hypothetical protein
MTPRAPNMIVVNDGRALELLLRDEVLDDLPAAPASAFDAGAAAGRQMLGHLGW